VGLLTKRDHDARTIFPSATFSIDTVWELAGVGESHRLAYQVNGFTFVLDVTASASLLGDWLAVYVQTMLDGVGWVDVVRFGTVTGDLGTARRVATLRAALAQAEFETGTGLAAEAVRHLLGDEWRVRWDIERGCSVLASFTFSVTAIPM